MPAYAASEIADACAEAIGVAAVYADLGPVEAPPAPELVGRRAWAANALDGLRSAAAPLEGRLAAELELPGPLGSVARRLAGGAIGVEAGLAAGYAARRVLGQYDLALLGEPRPPRLLFVEREPRLCAGGPGGGPRPVPALGGDPREHPRRPVRARGLARTSPARAGRRAARRGRGEHAAISGCATSARGCCASPGNSFARSFAAASRGRSRTPSARELLDRLQVTMSVVEGHAEHVMDACVADQGRELAELRRRMDERRANRGGLGDLLGPPARHGPEAAPVRGSARPSATRSWRPVGATASEPSGPHPRACPRSTSSPSRDRWLERAARRRRSSRHFANRCPRRCNRQARRGVQTRVRFAKVNIVSCKEITRSPRG